MTYLRINPVLALLLLLTAIAAALPFISYAPNRLVSGEGLHLWQLWPQTIWMLVGVGCAWLTACFVPAKKGSIFALILAQFVFVLLVWGAGKAATQLAQNGSALARTSLGRGFWLAAALALLACSDAIRRISTHPLWRWLLHMQIAIIPLWLLYSGTLNDLSLMKEYANRQDVFDDALAQHLTLLFGAVLPALVIGVPLGIWCYFPLRGRGQFFSAQCHSDRAFGGALWPVDCAACRAGYGLSVAGEARHSRNRNDTRTDCAGALCLAAAGARRGSRFEPDPARCAGERQSDGDERGAAFPACSVTAGVTGISAQPAGGDGANCRYGGDCGVNRRRRFWCAGFPGLLSSAIDLVLLGVIPVIVLAVLTDALFDLLIALLKVKRND